MAFQAQSNRQDYSPATDVRRLDETMVNRIAAGEVIERPASVVKELVENSIDAGASRVSIVTARGGKTLLRVSDNGHGMDRNNLLLAIERHCTSKLSDDLLDIRSLGFRGEALPSIGAVSQLAITSRAETSADAWQVNVRGGTVSSPKPAALANGTMVEVKDLFFATPARLKFLKSDQAETNAITAIFKRIALAFPDVHFSISGEDRSVIEYPASDPHGRLQQVLGKAFFENSMEIDAEREGVRLTGLASVPTFHRGNSLAQYFFVNGRPVRDKALLGAVRGAYNDFLPGGKHPLLALFIELDPHQVDVNVHPSKADVRFRDPGLVRGLVVGALKQAIAGEVPLTSRAGAEAMMQAFRPETQSSRHSGSPHTPSQSALQQNAGWSRPLDIEQTASGFAEDQAQFSGVDIPGGATYQVSTAETDLLSSYPLGAARAQLHKNYIVSQTETGLVIVDQHAAHERIVYEKLKKGMTDGLPSQLLLVPEIIDLTEEDVTRICTYQDDFHKLGLELEAFGPATIAVRGTPALLGEVDIKQLIHDLSDEVAEWNRADGLAAKLEYVAATMACHGSVRSGRILKPEEMNSLLRQMETTPNSGQCNHGRPTFIELDLKDIERLFGR
ncbi:MAG: DNA mismatch repair endonuclease MutL [Pseudomonadota bacterium]